MGAVISNYESQRRELRKALILATISDPNNKDLLGKITGLQRLIIEEHPELCATAARESARKFDYSPTSQDAAYHELDRLFTVYETGRILRSTKVRKGPVACPLGHHAVYFGELKDHPNPKPKPRCGICEKNTTSGYHCSYCDYNVCPICCVVYCSYGHEMILWTHEESDLQCCVCLMHPIHAGYRCKECEVDVCDFCTHKEGRAELTRRIFARMEANIIFMREHMHESATANEAIRILKKGSVGTTDGFPTILHLVKYGLQIANTKELVRLEVIQTRVIKEAMRLRDVLTANSDLCKTHARVKADVPTYPSPPLSEDQLLLYARREVSKLRVLFDAHTMAKSVATRSRAKVACPLGHAVFPFDGQGGPRVYQVQAMENGVSDPAATLLPPYCKICARLCATESGGGYNCPYCEYDLCPTCSVVFCSEGHQMVLWTIPEARGQRCYVCGKEELTAGYHCRQCFLNLCDMCTRQERRLDVRLKWERELDDIMNYMHDNRKRSDMAKYLHWRSKSVFVSLGALIDYVRHMRVCKATAEKQVRFKVFIDKMKNIRADIVADVEWSVTAVRESSNHVGPDGWYFRTKREAKNELRRLKAIVNLSNEAKRPEARHDSGIACVLGHAMVPLKDAKTRPRKVVVQEEVDWEHWENVMADSIRQELNERTSLSSSSSSKKKMKRGKLVLSPSGKSFGSKSSTAQSPPTPLATDAGGDGEDGEDGEGEDDEAMAKTTESQHFSALTPVYCETAQCRACLKDAFSLGEGCKTCALCEYPLCRQCVAVNCRRGHVMQIWTSYDAHQVVCDMCGEQNLIMGYRCNTCTIDVCDRCTRRDVRETLKLWPKRDIRKLIVYMESLQSDSDLARSLALKANAFFKRESDPSMSELCGIFLELDSSKTLVDQEIRKKREKKEAMTYSLKNTDF
jgi:hypothetical protein